MDPTLFGRTFVLGLTIAAAVGPITLLVIRRTLAAGWAVGMASGAGVATVDGLYGGVACLGLTVISDALVAVARPLGLAGGAALVVIGLRGALNARPQPLGAGGGEARLGLPVAYISTLALTLTNPLTIVLFSAIVVSLGLRVAPLDAAMLTAGFALGSGVWWVILVSSVAAVRTRLSPTILRWITIASGIGIATFGALAVIGVLHG